jgi:hypothetical protein
MGLSKPVIELPSTPYSPCLGDVNDFSQSTAIISSFVTHLNPGMIIHIMHLKNVGSTLK